MVTRLFPLLLPGDEGAIEMREPGATDILLRAEEVAWLESIGGE